MKRIHYSLLSLAVLFGFGLSPALASAAPLNGLASFNSDACSGLTQVDNGQGCNTGSNPVRSITGTFVTILSLVAGILGVIMIVVSGLRFITSGGDSGKVASARTALVYALIGLVVAALAQFLAHFVIAQSSYDTTPCGSNPKISQSDPSCKAK